MSTYKKSLFFENVFSADEIKELIAYFDAEPVAHRFETQQTSNKNLSYDIPGSAVNLIVRPKLAQLLNDDDHKFFGGAYKEYNVPYPLHIDNVIPTASITFKNEPNHQMVFLIPLMEGPLLKTVLFDVFMPEGHSFHANGTDQGRAGELEKFLLEEKTDINMEDFDHIVEPFYSMLPYIPLERIQPWKLGGVLAWPIDQLHCSTNFSKFNITKKFMVIMIN